MDLQAEKLHLIEQLLQIQEAKIIAQIQTLLKNSSNRIIGYDTKR